jgi:hypothetical protein
LKLCYLSLVLSNLILELLVSPLCLVKHLINLPKLSVFLTYNRLHLVLLLIDLALRAAVSEEDSEQLLNLLKQSIVQSTYSELFILYVELKPVVGVLCDIGVVGLGL